MWFYGRPEKSLKPQNNNNITSHIIIHEPKNLVSIWFSRNVREYLCYVKITRQHNKLCLHLNVCPCIAPLWVCICCMCVFNTLRRIVSPLVVGCQLSLQTEQMSFNCPSLLQTDTNKYKIHGFKNTHSSKNKYSLDKNNSSGIDFERNLHTGCMWWSVVLCCCLTWYLGGFSTVL